MAQLPLDSELDPALNFIFSLNSGPPQLGISTSHELDDDFSETLAMGSRQDVSITNATVPSSNLKSFGHLVKRHKKFSPESEAEFDDFCSVCHRLLPLF
jgi:hypothetical protein